MGKSAEARRKEIENLREENSRISAKLDQALTKNKGVKSRNKILEKELKGMRVEFEMSKKV